MARKASRTTFKSVPSSPRVEIFEAPRRRESGFTIVELLIVIVVIAILAAITLVAYNGVTKQANMSSAQSSARQVSTKLQAYFVQHDNYPTSLSAAGINESGGAEYAYMPSPAANRAWCLTATVGTQSVWTSDTQSSPTSGSCPGTDGNTVAPPAFWTQSETGAVYNASNGEITLSPTSNGALQSPSFPVTGSTSVALRFEIFATTASDQFAPQSGIRIDTNYYASDGVTPVQNPAGYAGNGDARPVALSQWVTVTTPHFATGPLVEQMRVKIQSASVGTGTHYTSDARIRNVRVIVNR